MAEKTLKYRDLIKILRRYGVSEERKRGKGSERILVRVIGGVKHAIATKCHNEGDQKPKGVIAAIRRRLRLTAADGLQTKSSTESKPQRVSHFLRRTEKRGLAMQVHWPFLDPKKEDSKQCPL